MKRFAVTMLTVCVYAVSALAQNPTGRLIGTVSAPDGAVPGATITIRDTQTNKERTVTSSEDGSFSIPQLEAGTYTVIVSAQGFKTFTATELKIDVGREYSLTPTLEVGSVSEAVTVIAGADVLNSTSAELSNTVEPRQILELPLNGRNPLALIQLQAGVASNGQTNTAINGQRPSLTNITRDGINVQDQFIRENASDFSPQRQTVDDISEFTVTTSNAGAEQGYGASHVQQVTPRGQSEFHGAAFAYNRNSYFAANRFFNNAGSIERAQLNRNQFGGKLSGPLPVPRFGEGGPALLRDKAFFFTSYEGLRLPVGSSRTRTILTPNARQGIFTYNAATNDPARGITAGQPVSVSIFDPRFGLGVQGIDPTIQSRILSVLPTTSNAIGGDGRNTAGYRFNQSNDTTRNQSTSRLDFNFSERQTLTGIFSVTRNNILRPDADDTGGFGADPITSNRSDNEFYVVAYQFTPSTSFSNEVRGGVFKSRVPFVRSFDPPSFFIGLPLVSNPDVTFLPQGRTSKNYNIQDNAQYQFGDHSFRFGGVAQIVRVDSTEAFSTVPTYTLGTSLNVQIRPEQFEDRTLFPGGVLQNQRGTANSLLSLLGGLVSTASQSFNATREGFEPGAGVLNKLAFENVGLYFSDQWRVTPRLTLNLGVRYDLFTPVRDLNSSLLEPVIPPGTDPAAALLNPIGRLDFVGNNAGGNKLFKLDKTNFAPILSFAYSPQFKNKLLGGIFGSSGRTVIRGGYSISYVNDEYLRGALSANESNPGLGATTTLNNLNARLDALPTIPVPTLRVPRTFAESNGLSSNGFAAVFAINPNIKVPFSQQYNFGVQREVGFNTAVEIRYVGGRSNNLTNIIDLNQIDIFSSGFLADFNRARQNVLASRAQLASQVAAGVPTAQRVPISGAFNANVPGSQQLSVFNNLGVRRDLSPVPGGLNLAGIIGNLDRNAPAQLAVQLIQNGLQGTVRLRPNENAGSVGLLDNVSRYNYNALQVEVRRRFSRGLYFQGNYTFSKTLTNASGLDQLRFEPRLDNNNPELEYTRADYDQTHRFNFNSLYELPFGRGKRFLSEGNLIDRLFGGFQFNSIVEIGSGSPITIIDARGTLNRDLRSNRQTPIATLDKEELKNLFGIFRTDDGIFYINPAVLQITRNPATGAVTSRAAVGFDTNTGQELTFPGQVFFNVPAGRTGNVERAIGTSPIFFNIDASLIKNVRIKEDFRVQLRAEAFNLLNRTNFNVNRLTQDINSNIFGQVTSSFDPRVLQFAVRVEF